MAARSCVPGFSEVVCTENGGPLSPDQFSIRQVIATAIRAPFGQENPSRCLIAVVTLRLLFNSCAQSPDRMPGRESAATDADIGALRQNCQTKSNSVCKPQPSSIRQVISRLTSETCREDRRWIVVVAFV